jgi:YhcH/YjgK/YiaL family protein
MNRFFTYSLTLLLIVPIVVSSCSPKKQSGSNTSDKDTVSAWFHSGRWLNGLELTPHSSIDQQEIAKQYHANKKWWDEAFGYLKTQDLENLKPGQYKIDGDHVYTIVVEGKPKGLRQIKWESHRHYNDLQYMVKGKVLMGTEPLSSGKVTEAYNDKKDIAHYTVKGGTYYIADQGPFLSFNPKMYIEQG